MSRGFIELRDDMGYRYIVNIDKIVNVCIDGKKVWTEEKTTLDICDKSMDYLRRRLVGDGK